MGLSKNGLLLAVLLVCSSCLTYSFTGVSIPENVRTVHFPLFPDQSPSGQSTLPDALNDALLDQFVNQSRLRFNPDKDAADAILEGRITGYTTKLAIIGGSGAANLSELTITIEATFLFADEAKPVFSKNFTATAQFDPNTNPIENERNAARQILTTIARNMFTDSLAKW